MRVLHVLPSMAPSYGGPSIALRGLVKALTEHDIYSEVITTDLGFEGKSITYENFTDLDGLRVRFFPRLLISYLPRDFAFSPDLLKWLRLHVRNYDIVHVHGFFNFPNTMAAYMARRAVVPYIIRPCGMLDPWCLRRGRLKKTIFLKLVGDSILRCAAALSFTTREEAEKSYMVKDQTHNFTIPLGVNALVKGPGEMIGHSLTSDKKIILFLSRIDPKKGIELLLVALARLKNVRSDFIAVIAGSGAVSYEMEIKSRVKAAGLDDIVHFVGFVEGGYKQQLLKNAACFVLPSYQENFGIAVAEAMAAGCPVIISNKVNIHEEVSMAMAGRVVDCNPEDLYITINEILDCETTRQQMAVNGRELVRKKYDWGQIALQTIAMYRKSLQRYLP